MRSTTNWQDAQPGVRIFMPATQISVQDTETSLSQLSIVDDVNSAQQSQHSRISDTVLPSCETESDVRVKDESIGPAEFHHARDDSPATLAGDVDVDIDEEMLVDISPHAWSTPESSVSTDIMFQLMEAVGSGSVPDNTQDVVAEGDENAISAFDDLLEDDYDSNRTDFRESPSPSVRRPNNASRRTTSAVFRHFRRREQSNAVQAPVRRLNFGNALKKQATKTAQKSASAQALVDLANVEKSPRHQWTDDERMLLCVLNRWYCGPDRGSQRDIFAKLFNSIFKLDVLSKKVRGQFESHLHLYGGEAYPVFGEVFSVPFDDPNGCYTQIRAHIEAEAVMLGLDLQKRHADSTKPSGMAKYARSPKTSSCYWSLVRRASEKAAWQASQIALTEDTTQVAQRIATASMAVRLPLEENWEILTDVEESPNPRIDHDYETTIGSAVHKPHLGFRVWDQNSRAQFSEERGFVTEWFVRTGWNGPPVAPFEPGSNALLMFASGHLSMESGVASPFASMATSLLQVLVKARKMVNPRIALIDLHHPSMQEPHKLLHVSRILPWLREHNQALWARYRGHCEWLCWAEIPKGAIIHYFELAELEVLARQHPTCGDLLSLDILQQSKYTGAVASNLRVRNLQLNATIACALGTIARTFGMAKKNSKLEHLRAFIARFVDGWSIAKPETDMQTASTLAAAFATAMGPHSGNYIRQSVMGAFMEGVEEGSRSIASWSRSGSRRRRFRNA